MESLAVRVAALEPVAVTGVWQRHASAHYPERIFDGRATYGRWGTRNAYPVLYLGQPTSSVVVEAYRHLVDPVENPDLLDQIGPRILATTTLSVSNVLDLRSAGARLQVGLCVQELTCDINDRAAYAACQTVSKVAHQLGRHGIIVPAATGAGETLALFTDLLPASEVPHRSGADIHWDRLPADPRVVGTRLLRIVRDGD